jgi:hypothetical protein
LLAHGRWFFPGTPVSSTTKTGCHDIAEILLKVALNTKNQNLSSNQMKGPTKAKFFLITMDIRGFFNYNGHKRVF